MCKNVRVLIKEGIEKGEEVILIEDWNARKGEEKGNDDEDAYRQSKDKIVNAEEKKLIRFCTEDGLSILNGRIEGD